MACMKKSKSKLDPVERFLGLSDTQKEAEVARFDSGIDASEWKPLTPSQRKRWDKSKHSVAGRKLATRKMLAVSVERGLLKEADAFAKRHDLKRSQMVAEGLRLVMQRRAG